MPYKLAEEVNAADEALGLAAEANGGDGMFEASEHKGWCLCYGQNHHRDKNETGCWWCIESAAMKGGDPFVGRDGKMQV
jgi:hypothetical protein